MYRKNTGLVYTFLIGLALVIIVIPWAERSLRNRHVDLNGIVLDGIETIENVFQRQFGGEESAPPNPDTTES